MWISAGHNPDTVITMRVHSVNTLPQPTTAAGACPRKSGRWQRYLWSSVALFTLGTGLVLTQPARVNAQNQKELVTDADLRSLRVNNPQYFKALGAGSLNSQDTTIIRDFMRIQVLQMSLKANERTLPSIREKLKREIDMRAKPAAKDVMLPEIVKNCMLLLQHPLPVQLNAVMLITELNEASGEVTKDIPPTPYQGMVEPLLQIINDPGYHEALKVTAVNGLERVCRDSNPKVDVRLRIADALVKQLERSDTSEWYRMSCIHTLARTDILNDAQKKPFIVQKLAEILVDPQQGWRVRVDAAHALGRVQMDSSINVSLIVHEIVRFAHEMGQQFNKTKNAPHWRYCAWRLYLTFRPEDGRDIGLLDRTGRAPLTKFKAETQAAYDLVLPIVNGILESMPAQNIAANRLDALKTWLDSNPPPNQSVSLDPNVKVKPLRSATADAAQLR